MIFFKILKRKNKLQTERICNRCCYLVKRTQRIIKNHTPRGGEANKRGEPGTRERPGQCYRPGQRPQRATCCPRPSNHGPEAFPLEVLPSPHSDLSMTCRPKAPAPPSLLPSLPPTATSIPSRPHCPCACRSTSDHGSQGGLAHKAATCAASRPPANLCVSPVPF